MKGLVFFVQFHVTLCICSHFFLLSLCTANLLNDSQAETGLVMYGISQIHRVLVTASMEFPMEFFKSVMDDAAIGSQGGILFIPVASVVCTLLSLSLKV